MVYNRDEVVKRANASTSNQVDTCQLWTRTIIGVPSAGDYDHDGDADAVDGWKSEPTKFKHAGDRHPPAGVPVSYSGGSAGHGHRAISLGNGKIRSTDANGNGHVATVDLDWPEKHWGLKYLGWSDTMDGILVPEAPKPDAKPKSEAENLVEQARDLLRHAKSNAKKNHKPKRLLKLKDALHTLPEK